MTSLSYLKIVCALSFCALFPLSVLLASESNGTIEAGSATSRICRDVACTEYGTLNWRPTGVSEATVTDSGLSGYIWGDEIGWVNLSPTNSGVSINPTTGVLSGYAFANTGSWINFNPTDVAGGTDVGVSINALGEFTGWAWVSGAYGGWMKFDCTSPSTCVKTDWRPLGSRSDAEVEQGASGGYIGTSGNVTPSLPPSPIITIPDPAQYEQTPIGNEVPPFIRDNITNFYIRTDEPAPPTRLLPMHVESYTAPLTVNPQQTGLLVWDFSSSDMKKERETLAVVLEIPAQGGSETLTFFVSIKNPDMVRMPRRFHDNEIGLVGNIFEVTAIDADGNEVTTFDSPITITLYDPEIDQNDETTAVYHLSSGSSVWSRVENASFVSGAATFTVDHLSLFGVFRGEELPETLTLPYAPFQNPFVWLIALLLFCVLIYWRNKKN